MEMNKEEAEKCREIGKRHLRTGSFRQAIRFFEKSHRMYPLPGVEAMRDRAQQELKREEEAAARARSASSSASSSGGHHESHAHRRHHSAAAPASAPKAEEPARPYTAAQVQIVNKIRACKNHYEVLAVPQVADDNEIKKAYRKVRATRCHCALES